jgi:hypothetical protein
MYRLLVIGIVATAFLQLRQDLALHPRHGLQQQLLTFQHYAHKVIKINWKPISVFPEKAVRFQ